jgi:RNA polymerase sporulation-specific sigma factor
MKTKEPILSPEEKEQVAEQHYKIIYHIAGKFKSSKFPPVEIISASQMGFAKALNSYRTDKDVKFTSYAWPVMTNEILQYIRKEKKRISTLSLDAARFENDKGKQISLLDQLVAEPAEYDWEALNHITTAVLSTCSKREKEAFQLFLEHKRQHEIAVIMGISRSYVSRLEKNVLQKIKKAYWKEEERHERCEIG